MDKKSIARITGATVMLLLLVTLPVIGGCAPEEAAPPAPTPVAKPSVVKLYGYGDLSGPLAPVSGPVVAAMSDCAKWYYEEKGGIDGVPVEIIARDTEYKLDLALSAYNTFREEKPKPLVFFTWGSAECEALKERFVEDEIVGFMYASTTVAIYPPGYMFMFTPSYTDHFGAFMDWVVDVWAKETGEKVKLGICTWDNAYGKAILVDECRDYAKKKGIEIVAEEVFPVTALDVNTQMTRIKAAGANWVYDNTLGHAPGVVSKSAADLGMLAADLDDTTPGMVHRATSPFPGGSSTATVFLAPEVTEGLIMNRALASWSETDNPGIQLALSIMEKNNRGPEMRGSGYLSGIAGIYTVCEAINAAVDAVGWENLDGKAVKEQLEKFKDLDVLGLGKITFSVDKHEPRKVRIYQVQGGEILPITDYVTCPDLRPYE